MATVLLAGTVVLQGAVIASGDGDHALSSSASTSSPLTGIDLNDTLGLYALTSASAPFSLTDEDPTITIIGPTEDVDGNTLTWSYQVSSGSLEDSTVSQSSNSFTITSGVQTASFTLQFTAQDGNGNSAVLESSFGYVSPLDGKLVVGAQGESNWAGGVYVYDLDGSNQIKLQFPEGSEEPQDRFGYNVAAANNKVYVSALHDDKNTSGDQMGSVWIFDEDGTNGQVLYPSIEEHDLNFGRTVVAGGGKLAVAADGSDNQGKLFIYDADGSNEIIPTNQLQGGYIHSMAIDDSRLVVGNSAEASVQVYNLDGTLSHYLHRTTYMGNNDYGYYVAMGDGKIAVSHRRGAYIFDVDGSNEQGIHAVDGAHSPKLAIGGGKLVMGIPDQDKVNVYNLNTLALETSFGSSFGTQSLHQFGHDVAVKNEKIYVSKLSTSTDQLGSIEMYDLDGSNGQKISDEIVSGSYFGYSIST